MMSKKSWRILSVFVAAGLALSACAEAAPVVQTVVVKEIQTVEAIVTKEVEKIVEKEKEVIKEVAVTATPAFEEWRAPHPKLSDIRVRQAIAYCSNRPELIQSVYSYLPDEDRAALLMDTYIPRDSAWYAKTVNPNANIVDYPFDADKGGALLEEAGWKLAEGATTRTNEAGEPLTLRFTTTNAPFRQTWGGVFVRQMAQCGIQLLPSYIPGSIWFGGASGLRRRDFDLGAFAWVGEPEPPSVTLYACDQIPTPANNWNGQNYMGWCNEAASNAIKSQQNTLDADKRKAFHVTVQEEFSKDMISLPVFQRLEATGASKDLQGLVLDANEYFSASAWQWELPGKTKVVVAQGQEAASLFLLQESAAVAVTVGQLIYGVDVTSYNYDYQAFGYEGEAFPTIANGGATNTDVEIKEGDRIANKNGDVGALTGGKLVGDDGTEYELVGVNAAGEDVEIKVGAKMAQLVVTGKIMPRNWHDGEPLKKADFELGYKITCDKESGAVSYFGCERTASFEAVSDTSWKTTFVPGYQTPDYYRASGFGYYPSHRVIETEGPYKGKTLAEVEPKDWKTLPEVTENVLGTGPFKLVSWEKGVKFELVAFEGYWKGAPKVAAIDVQLFEGNPAGAVAALLQGTVDVVGKEVIGAGAELETVIKEGAAGNINGEPGPSPTWEHVDINLNVRYP